MAWVFNKQTVHIRPPTDVFLSVSGLSASSFQLVIHQKRHPLCPPAGCTSFAPRRTPDAGRARSRIWSRRTWTEAERSGRVDEQGGTDPRHSMGLVYLPISWGGFGGQWGGIYGSPMECLGMEPPRASDFSRFDQEQQTKPDLEFQGLRVWSQGPAVFGGGLSS